MTYERHVNRRVSLQLSMEEAERVWQRVNGFSGDNNLLETERATISQCLATLQAVINRLRAELESTDG